MTSIRYVSRTLLLYLLVQGSAVAQSSESVREAAARDDFVIREEMITMRDGVELYTLIIIPNGGEGDRPILMHRTPYSATRALSGPTTTKLEVLIGPNFVGEDYIYVFQDIRGRFKSGGDYILFRPPIGILNDSTTDHATDTYDTIEWFIKNIPSNGKVGIWGTSYPAWLALGAIKDPHPNVAAAVSMNPVVDVWKADDFFHWGAFRGGYAFTFVYLLQTRKDQFVNYPFEKYDFYEFMLEAGAFGTGLSDRLDERHEMWNRIVSNPAYSDEWREIAADQWFDSPRRLVPTMHVHGLWDQEDIYGAPAVYAAMEKHDSNNDLNYFVAGPWYHNQHHGVGERLGDIRFDESTAIRFREDVLKPFFRKFLHEEDVQLAPVTTFESGSNRWRSFEKWPPDGKNVRLHLWPEGKLAFEPPNVESSQTEYISDPASPVPYAPRPIFPINYQVSATLEPWRRWLVEDQRFADDRPDTVAWISQPLEEPITIRGSATVNLTAETTGTDADWVVKLIDVFPDPSHEMAMSGYQFMITGDIFRGRYRESYEEPSPIKSNTPLEYVFPLPHVNHTIKKGHRIMIQVQSSWFPLYDRNPQTWVENIMFAPPEAYKVQTHKVHHDRSNPTYIEFTVD